MDENNKTESLKPDPPQSRKQNLPVILLRISLTIFFGTILGVFIYLTVGWIPNLDQHVFRPIKNNRADIWYIRSTQESLENDFNFLQENNISILATLEQMEKDNQQLIEDDLSLMSTVEMGAQLALQHTQTIATLDAKIGSTDRNFSALATAQLNNLGFQQRLILLKVLDLLTLANQYLLHANFGQAEDLLMLVKTELETLYIQTPAYQQTFIHDLLNLVEGAVEDLPQNYSIAEDKMQLAIQMALQGFPEFDPSVTLTPTPYITPYITPSLTPTPQS